MLDLKTRHIICYALLNTFLLAGVWGCRKDVVNQFTPYPANQVDFGLLLADVPGATTQSIFQLGGIAHDTMLLTPSGVRIFLTDVDQLLADEQGQTVAMSTCPNLLFELTEVSKKGEFIARNLPSVSEDGKLLEVSSAFELRFLCGNAVLQLKNNRSIRIQAPASNRKDDLFVFHAPVQQAQIGAWTNSGEPVYLADWLSPDGQETIYGYEIVSKQLGWVSNSKPVAGPYYSFCITIPDGFTTQNTRTYMVYKNIKSVVLLQQNTNSFQFCTATAPAGYPVKLLTISEFGGQYWMGVKETETGSNGLLNIVPQIVSKQQLIDALKSY